jgi:hypothetical protein
MAASVLPTRVKTIEPPTGLLALQPISNVDQFPGRISRRTVARGAVHAPLTDDDHGVLAERTGAAGISRQDANPIPDRI